MSEANQQETNQHEIEKAERLEERVEVLAQMVRDIDDDYAKLSARLNNEMLEYQDRLKNKIEGELSEMHKEISNTLAVIREQFAEKVQERIQAASSDEIAEALTTKLGKLILVTRPATRDEIKTGHRDSSSSPSESRN